MHLASIVIFTALTSVLDATTCPGAWRRCGSYCLLFKRPERMTWLQANAYCKRRHAGATLVISRSDHMKRVLANRMGRDSFWVGLSDREQEGVYKFLDGSTADSKIAWIRGEPSDRNRSENCAEMQQKCYRDSPCHDRRRKLGFVCSFPTSQITTPLPYIPNCKGGRCGNHGRCVQVLPTPMERYDAEEACKSLGGHLATVITPEDADSIALAAYPNGLPSWGGAIDYWIGLIRGCDLSEWSWQDGTPISDRHLKWRHNPEDRGVYVSINLRSRLMDWADEEDVKRLPAVCMWNP